MARIIGEVDTRWLKTTGPDRKMRLLADFCFEDNKGRLWKAPEKSIIDGASIPRCLWSVFGDPFIGDYRRASVIHDVYCKDQEVPHKQVHKMFHEFMLADGVGPIKAQAMYFAVKTFGPKWDTIEE